MIRELNGSEGRRAVPGGVTLIEGVDRHDDQAMRAFYEVNTRSFPNDDDPSPFEVWRNAWVAATTTPYDDWILIRAGDEPIGALMAADASADSGGWVDTVAVVPDHRGRGLGQLLLDHAFGRFWQQGRGWAGLGYNTANLAAGRCYAVVGMRTAYEYHVWRLEVRARG
jgi:GNAT superfamily N-acetyltransferase